MKTLLLFLALGIQAFALPPIFPTAMDIREWTDSYLGLGARRDDEQAMFALSLVKRTRASGGTVRVTTWNYRGRQQFHAESRNPDGSWTGPTPSMGFYTSPRVERIIVYPKP